MTHENEYTKLVRDRDSAARVSARFLNDHEVELAIDLAKEVARLDRLIAEYLDRLNAEYNESKEEAITHG